jgi:hypothetical protein
VAAQRRLAATKPRGGTGERAGLGHS